MIGKEKLVWFMVIAAVAIGLIAYAFTGSLKWALGVAGVCLALDLTFAPFIMKRIKEIQRGNLDE